MLTHPFFNFFLVHINGLRGLGLGLNFLKFVFFLALMHNFFLHFANLKRPITILKKFVYEPQKFLFYAFRKIFQNFFRPMPLKKLGLETKNFQGLGTLEKFYDYFPQNFLT